jgi:cytochrome c biogenesis protein CcmG/thiol:disulfide interchange protein DsbE
VRKKVLVGLGVLVVALVAGGVSVALGTRQAPRVPRAALLDGAHFRPGAAAPDFRLPLVSDPHSYLALDQLRGHPVLLAFFASWCVQCAGELPVLEDFARSHPEARVVGVDSGDVLSRARAFIAQAGVAFPVLLDPEQALAIGSYGVGGVPASVFITRDQRVAGEQLGLLTAQALSSWEAVWLR